MTIQWLLLSRRRFKKMVLSQSGMSTPQFIRLLLMAVILSGSTACACIFQIIVNIKQNLWELGPYVNWAWVHDDFWRVDQYPNAILPPFLHTFAWVFFMLAPYAGLVFFLLFGLSGEPLAALLRVTGYEKRRRDVDASNQRRQKAPERNGAVFENADHGVVGDL